MVSVTKNAQQSATDCTILILYPVQLSVVQGDMGIRKGELPGEYKLVQFHVHWGNTNSGGSEHTVNGRSHPMEVCCSARYHANDDLYDKTKIKMLEFYSFWKKVHVKTTDPKIRRYSFSKDGEPETVYRNNHLTLGLNN